MRHLPRIYCEQNLSIDSVILLNEAASYHLLKVLRLKEGKDLLLFNAKDGEFYAKIALVKKAQIIAQIYRFNRAVDLSLDILFCPAVIKKPKMQDILQKAVELGVNKIQPVVTDYVQDSKLNYEKLQLNIIEATQQCNRLDLAQLLPLCKLTKLLQNWDENYHLLFCDEKLTFTDNSKIFADILQKSKKIAILIGPEGGFSEKERQILRDYKFCRAISLGSRILRSETASIAAIALAAQYLEQDKAKK